MHDFAHLLDRTIYPLQPVIILAAFIAWGLAAAGQISAIASKNTRNWRRTISPRFAAGSLIFVAIIGIEFGIAGVLRMAALEEIRPKLSADIESATVNGVHFDISDGFIADLRNIHGTFGHHSSPTANYRLFLQTSRGPLTLELRRDSQDMREYWVFYTEFNATKLNDVGHVFTDALDSFKPTWQFD
jgi:hypothetical protein